MNLEISDPKVEPNKQHGIKIITKLKFTNDVILVGCYLIKIET